MKDGGDSENDYGSRDEQPRQAEAPCSEAEEEANDCPLKNRD